MTSGSLSTVGTDLAVDALVDRASFGGVRGDDPVAVGVLFEQQVDEAHMRAPEAGHHGGLAGQRAVLGIGAFEVGEILVPGNTRCW